MANVDLFSTNIVSIDKSSMTPYAKQSVSFIDYYKKHIQGKYTNKNIPEVQCAAQMALTNTGNVKLYGWLIKKIKNHLKSTGLSQTVEEVLREIKKNILLASFFAKSPTKQNESERCQKEFLEQYRGITLSSLPQIGPLAHRFYFATGELLQAPKQEGYTSHSIDYSYNGPHWDDYIMGKVTMSQGGAQNQQRQEMLDLLPQFEKWLKRYHAEQPRVRFVLLLDGDNYTSNGSGRGLDAFYALHAKSEFPHRILITNCNSYDPNTI